MALNASAGFIRRPVATSLMMLAITVFGVLAYHVLPVSDLPSVDYPTLVVMAGLAGANPDTMASAVATPLERQFTTIAGLDSMISTNSQGSTQITLTFDLSRDLDGAAVDVQTAIAEAMPLLPPGMPSPPSFRKYNPADAPILMMNLTSSTLPMWELQDYAESKIAQRLSMINGVAQVNVMGAQKYAVRVQVDPDKLSSMKIGLNEVDQALRSWNVNLPTGTLWGDKQALNIRADGMLRRAENFRPIIISYRNGAPVRLEDVATVSDSVEDNKNGSWIFQDGKGLRAINLMVMRQPGSNTVEVTDNVKAVIPEIEKDLPPSARLVFRGDRSKLIRESFDDVQFTMVVAMGLVILVIFLFLRNASATFIPGVALPLSLLGTLAVMFALGYSLNNLSMMALILSVGFVVDDAIVMLENIVRHIEAGMSPMDAAFQGSREIGFTIVSMSVSLAAVFIPILFMGGLLGRLFREFAVTICIAIFFSAVVSISLTPMLCSRLLRHRSDKKPGLLFRSTEWVFQKMLGAYEVSLSWVLHHRPVMLLVFFGTIGATIYMFETVPKGFIPDTDSDQMNVSAEANQGTSYYQMNTYQQRIAEVLSADPNIESVMASTGGMGGPGGGGGATARFMVTLKPRKERELSVFDLIAKLRPRLSQFPGLRVNLSAPSSIRIGGRASRSQYDFTMQGPDTDALYVAAQTMLDQMILLPQIAETSTDLQMRSPRINLDVDRDKAAALGLNIRDVSNSLYNAFGPRWSSTIYAPNNQYRVLIELLPEFQSYPDLLSRLSFKNSAGALIPMDAFARTYPDVGPQSINHSGQLPSVTLSFSPKPGVALGDVVTAVEDLARTVPGVVSYSFQGTAKAFQDSLSNLGVLLAVAIMVVYIALGVLYESYIHPLTILSGLPSAVLGALLTLQLYGVEMNIYAFVGLFMLIGIVKKNAIMQIDFALEAERRDGKSARDAIYEGCLIRFRPILMTTMAAMLGTMPIALGYGSGGEARRPLGLTVVGGLLVSQLVTLYLTPVVYTYLDAIVERWRRTHPEVDEEPSVAVPSPVGAAGD